LCIAVGHSILSDLLIEGAYTIRTYFFLHTIQIIPIFSLIGPHLITPSSFLQHITWEIFIIIILEESLALWAMAIAAITIVTSASTFI
jgi:hypothetical protein